MRLREIRLCPFAGLSDRRVSFGPQLNVVLGDNEAGKTTVFRALESVLFKRTDLTPARMKDFVRPYLPIGGGDTIAVELRFEHGGGDYQLRREWGGARPGASLTLPDGNIVTQENSIAERMESMLGATEGTYRSVLLTYQSGLGQTLADLANDAGTTRALGDLLTSAVQETDGVSVEAFKDKLRGENEAFFSHWDSARVGPEGGRGLQNPWRRQVGWVLQAWYEKEARQQAWDEAVELENQVDALNARLAVVSAAFAEAQNYVTAHAPVADSVAERQTIASQEALLEERLRTLRQANAEWPVLEQAIRDIGPRCHAFEERLVQLAAESEAAQKAEAQKDVRAQLKRVAGRQQQLDEAKRAFEATPVLDADTLKKIDGLEARCRELKAQLSGGTSQG
jgi:exonuclease SbcC